MQSVCFIHGSMSHEAAVDTALGETCTPTHTPHICYNLKSETSHLVDSIVHVFLRFRSVFWLQRTFGSPEVSP